MFGSQFDGNSLFSGGGFMPSQATQVPDSGQSPSSRNRGTQGVFPLTVKQISEASQSNEDKSNFVVDGAEVTNVRLLGLVVNKLERVTDVSFTLDDGTGRMDVTRWVNEASDTNEMAAIQNGMYVKVSGHLKGFQGKIQVTAFSIRPVTDFDDITLHFIECIHVHLYNTKLKKIQGGDHAPMQTSANPVMNSSHSSGLTGYQTSVSNQFTTPPSVGKSDDINEVVLGVFQEPANLARDHGIHVDEVVQRLRIPVNKVRAAIDYLVNEGVIYSTIDDNHFKSACNG